MVTTDSNGVVFYQESDLFSPVHTMLNLQSAAVSEIVDEIDEQLSDLSAIYRYMQRSTTQNFLTNSWQTLEFLTLTDQSGWSSYSGGDWTIPADGRYAIDLTMSFEPRSGGQRIMRVLKNGAVVAQGAPMWVTQDSVPAVIELHSKMVCSAGDVLQIQLTQTSGSTIAAYYGGTLYNRFAMERIGPA